MKHHHFFPIFLALVVFYLGLHFYSARWLARGFGLSPAAAAGLRLTFLCLAFLSPLTMFLKRHYASAALDPLFAAGYTWMGAILIAAFIFFCSDLAAMALRRAALPPIPRLPALTLTALGFVLSWAVYGGFKDPPIREMTITLPGLPPSLDGLKIAQISDMHVDSTRKLRQFSRLVAAIDAAAPDLVVFTGDLIDPGITCRDGLREAAGELRARLGIYGALGNHEYYYGLDKAMACYQSFGIKLLHNTSTDLGDLKLIGLGDVHTEGLSADDVTAIMRKAGGGKFRLVLNHQPVYYPELAAAGAGLVLSGHTHRGQIAPFNFLTRLAYRYFYGLYHIDGTAFYVTSGAGTWGPPLRWLAPAEVPLITLKKR